jgi:hypothetical protein
MIPDADNTLLEKGDLKKALGATGTYPSDTIFDLLVL